MNSPPGGERVHGGGPSELRPDVSISAIAEFASLISGPARTSMLVALLDEEWLTAKLLADVAGVTPQTASGHIEKLMSAGLITMEKAGRHHHHRLASRRVAELVRSLYAGGAEIQRGRSSDLNDDSRLRAARTCGNHIAGTLGVGLARALVGSQDGAHPELTAAGRELLLRWGLGRQAVETLTRSCSTCLDWSERSPHLNGGAGATLLRHSARLGWVRRHPNERRLTVTSAGRQGFSNRFGITLENGEPASSPGRSGPKQPLICAVRRTAP